MHHPLPTVQPTSWRVAIPVQHPANHVVGESTPGFRSQAADRQAELRVSQHADFRPDFRFIAGRFGPFLRKTPEISRIEAAQHESGRALEFGKWFLGRSRASARNWERSRTRMREIRETVLRNTPEDHPRGRQQDSSKECERFQRKGFPGTPRGSPGSGGRQAPPKECERFAKGFPGDTRGSPGSGRQQGFPERMREIRERVFPGDTPGITGIGRAAGFPGRMREICETSFPRRPPGITRVGVRRDSRKEREMEERFPGDIPGSADRGQPGWRWREFPETIGIPKRFLGNTL
jgi:hypothetical protein